jgi:HSP20 family protein
MTTSMTAAPRRRTWPSLLDEVFGDFFAPGATAAASGSRSGAVPMNVAERSDAFVLSFELPGVRPEDADVQVDGDQLVVTAERKFEHEKAEGLEFRRVEHRYGSFARTVVLPKDVRFDAIDAQFQNGVLTVTVPKAEPSQARKIAIRTN